MLNQPEPEPHNLGVMSELGPLRVESLASDGRGVARDAGRVWFVERGLPGDLVEIAGAKSKGRFFEGRVGRLLEAGPGRRSPECAVQPSCGGCPWMTLEAGEQRRAKGRIVRDALERLGGLRGAEVDEVVPSTEALGYRNRVEFVLRLDAVGRPAIGFYGIDARGSRGVVDVARCEVLDPRAAPAVTSIRAALSSDPRLDPLWSLPDPFRVLVRSGDGGALVALRGPAAPPAVERAIAEAAARALQDRAIVGVVRIYAARGRRGGARSQPLGGRDHLEVDYGGTKFRIPAGSFTQVHDAAAERLIDAVVERAGEVSGRTVLDLYGGIGVYGWRLASLGARVTVVEADARAVAFGRHGWREGGVPVAPRFAHRDAGEYLAADPAARCDVVVANPPRTGLGRGVVEGIVRAAATRIILVSCDPATFARDLRRFHGLGWRIVRVTPFDLFPHTPHVEIVAALEPRGSPV